MKEYRSSRWKDLCSIAIALTNERILQLSKWVLKIEEYYIQLKKHWCPMDVEWAIDGLSKELFIVQARPETIHSQKDHSKITGYKIDESTPRHDHYSKELQ